MPTDIYALATVAGVLISGALWLLHEAKKYRARMDAEKRHGAGHSQTAH